MTGAVEVAPPTVPTVRADMKMLAYWITLGAAAGGLGGLLVGGIGGRIGMFILRLTSDDYVRGIESDDGFTIGRFDLVSTLNLLITAALLGTVVGLLIVAGRPFLPKRGAPLLWAVAGALVGGALLVQDHGVDFVLLSPQWLAIAMFILIPALGALVIASLTSLLQRFWWRQRRLTIIAAIGALPALVFFPITILAVGVSAVWLLAIRSARLRTAAHWRPVRVAALVVFGAACTLGAIDLTGDAKALH